MTSRLVLILVTVFALIIVNAYAADSFEIPNSEIGVQVDGVLDESEWADAGQVRFVAVNGETVEVMVKYDAVEDSLFFGVNIPDSSFDDYDRFFICVDNNDDIELNPQPDDFILCISRGTAYMGMYHQYYKFYRTIGTGTGWDINNLHFNSRVLAEPFRKLEWNRTEAEDAWVIEMMMDLNRDQTMPHDFGLVFKQTDVDGDTATTIYHPEYQPEAINYPTNWTPATIPVYTLQAPAGAVEEITEPEPELSNGIPGFSFFSIILGLWLIMNSSRKQIGTPYF